MNEDLDLIVDTKLYEYAKTGMELSLTMLCQQLGADKYLSKNNFLKQEYSLTTPFSDYDNLEVFLETLNDVKEIAQNELLHRNDKQLYSIMVLLVIALVINIVQLVCNGTFKREED